MAFHFEGRSRVGISLADLSGRSGQRAVFSGQIAYRNFDDNISKILANVVNAFSRKTSCRPQT
jgi:hypothetical protein